MPAPAGAVGAGAARVGAPAGAGAARGVGAGGGRGRGLVPNDWNDINIVLDTNALRPIVNTTLTNGGAADETSGKFGPIALYVGGTGSVRFRDVSYKDLGLKRWAKEQLSPNFRMQRVNPFYYAFSVAAADVDRDGNMDFVSGPFIYMGPDFVTAREFYAAETINPSNQFSSNWVGFAGDYTGDGWPDVLLASTSGSKLYVNPKGEARRWDMYPSVIPPGGTQAEISAMKDIDADGKLDLVYGSAGAIRWAKPDPANPTGPWLSVQVGEPGTYAAHGIGAGDINGDGRVDIVNGTGWWEQPAKGTPGTWPFHAANYGRGGAEMAVYDINGDGRNDVVTSLMAHGFGLAWFEQKREASGTISFEQHTIFDNFASPDNAGGVAFSEPHGSTMGDINGDGLQDFVVGKRFFSHKETYLDPDPYGAPVLYAYITVRDPKAPGGARFVPELIHNQSGAGSQVLALDMNKDGVTDVLTTTSHGSFVFFGKARAGVKRVATR